MVKGFYASVLGFAALVCGGCATPDPYTAICQIQVSDGQGSGTLIGLADGRGLVLTARHVAIAVNSSASFDWLAAGGQHTAGTVAVVPPGDGFVTDMSLLVCDAPRGVRPLVVDRFTPENGPWRCVGYRSGVMYESVVFGAYEHDGVIEVDEPFTPGMSGGAMLDCNNHVVGVVVGSDLKTFGIVSDGQTLAALVAAHTQ